MGKQKKNSKTYLLISLGVLAAIVITLGVTYAYWRLTKEQTNENVVTTACLDVDIESQQDDINLPKAYPISDEDGANLVPFKFTIHNKCEDNASFQINLESMSKNGDLDILEAQRLSPKYLKFKLNEVNQNGITRLLTGSKEEDTTKVTTTITNAYDAHKLMSGYIEPNGSKSYEFRIWMDSETTAEEIESMNKTFVSKISVTSTYLKENDLKPTAELALSVCENNITLNIIGEAKYDNNIAKYEYQIDSNEWKKGNTVNEITNQENGKHTIKARVTDNKGMVSEEVEQEINLDYIEPTSANLLGQDITLTKEENGLYKVSHCGVSGTIDDDGFSKAEYRYAGVNYINDETPYVHNYVEFNNEKWRIIGLVNVKTSNGVEQRLKIIRTDGIEGQKDFGLYAWDRGSSGYTNNWTTSKLKDMLNGIYYTSEAGECYTKHGISSATQRECDFSGDGDLPKGLDEETRKMIDSEVIWNLSYSSSYLDVEKMYETERKISTGDNTRYPYLWTKENDGMYHNGIGLMYASDYGYATSKRDGCLTEKLEEWRYGTNCANNDWLKVSDDEWLLSGFSGYYANSISSNGDVIHELVIKGFSVFPTIYLTPSVTIYDGDGSFNNPFRLQNES